MFSGSSESDNISSTEDVELTNLAYKWSTKLSKAEEQADDMKFSNISDGNHHEFDIERTSSSIFEGTSSGYLTRACESSSNQEMGALNRKALSQEGFSSKVLVPNHKKRHSTRKVSSLTSLEECSTLNHHERNLTMRVLSLDSLERHPNRKDSCLEPLVKFTARNDPFLNPLEGHSTTRISALDHKERHCSRRVSSLDSLENTLTRGDSALKHLEPLNRKVSSLNPLERHSTRRVSSLDRLERHSARRVSFLDRLERHSARRVSSLDRLERHSARRVSSLDPLERHSARRVSSLEPIERQSARRVSFLDSLIGTSTDRDSSIEVLNKLSNRMIDPLEGPSTSTVWFSDSTEDSLSGVLQSRSAETETNVHSVHSTEEENCESRMLTWLSSLVRHFTRQITHSKFYLLFHVALYFISFSAVHMGSKYYHLCDGCPKLTSYMYLLGTLGTWLISVRLLIILSKRYLVPPLTGHELDTAFVTLFLPFLVLLMSGMFFTYSCDPVFTPPHTELCVKVFYNYAYYFHIVVPLIFLLLELIEISAED